MKCTAIRFEDFLFFCWYRNECTTIDLSHNSNQKIKWRSDLPAVDYRGPMIKYGPQPESDHSFTDREKHQS